MRSVQRFLRCALFDPELYTLIHRGNPGDLQYYVDACKGASTALELGCGAGRITCALAEAGISVTGVDIHPGMLELARRAVDGLDREARSRVTLIEGDMASLELGTEFDRVLIPYNGLYCLLTDDLVIACLERAKAHLTRETGRLVLDGYLVSFDEESLEPGSIDEPLSLGLICEEYREIEVFETTRWDPGGQFMDVEYRHEIRGEDGKSVVRYSIPQRYLLPDQLFALAHRAGLEVLSLTLGFTHDEEDRQILLVAKRPAEEQSPSTK